MNISSNCGRQVRNIICLHLQNSLFLHPCDQQMVAEIKLKACNKIGLGNFAATVTEIHPSAGQIDHSQHKGFVMTPDCVK